MENEVRLNIDPDHEDNLIALCRDCHKIFDNPRTIEGYREMVELKKELQQIAKQKKLWHENKIEEELNVLITSLVSFKGEDIAPLSLTAMRVDEKADDSLNFMIRLKIKNNVQYFYKYIQSRFAELDKVKPYTSDTIFSQVKTYYLKLKKEGFSQDRVFKALTEWISVVTNTKNNEAAEIIVSFFIQNCEVFS